MWLQDPGGHGGPRRAGGEGAAAQHDFILHRIVHTKLHPKHCTERDGAGPGGSKNKQRGAGEQSGRRGQGGMAAGGRGGGLLPIPCSKIVWWGGEHWGAEECPSVAGAGPGWGGPVGARPPHRGPPVPPPPRPGACIW